MCVCVQAILGANVFVFQIIDFLHSDEYTYYSSLQKQFKIQILNDVYTADGSEILVHTLWEMHSYCCGNCRMLTCMYTSVDFQ